MALSITTGSSSARTRIASAIAKARTSLGWTQQQLAEAASIKPGRIKRAEDGSGQAPATLAAIWKALDAAGAGGLDHLREAVQAHQAKPQRRAWRHLRGWDRELHDMLPDTIKLRVTCEGGVYLPSGQAAPFGAVVTITRPKSVADYVQAVENGLMEPASPADGEALAMHLKAETDLPYLVGDGPQKPAGMGWSGKWTRLGSGGLQSALDANRQSQEVPAALTGFVSAARR